MKSFILIQTIPNHEHKVYNIMEKMKKKGWVKDVFPLFGEYDFIVEIDSHTSEISRQIRDTKGVLNTKILITSILK